MTEPYIRRALLNQHATGEDRQPQELKVERLSRPPTVLSTRPPRGSSPRGRYSPRGARGRGTFNLSSVGGHRPNHGPGTGQTLPPSGDRGRPPGQRFTANSRPFFSGRGAGGSNASYRGSPISPHSLPTHRQSQWQAQEFDLSHDRDGQGYDEIQMEMDEGSINLSEISSGSRARDENNYEQNGHDGKRKIRRGRHSHRTSPSSLPRLPLSQRLVPTHISPSPSPPHPSDAFSPLQYPVRSSPPIAAFKFEDRSPPHSPLLGSTNPFRRSFSPSEIPNQTPPPSQNRNFSNTHESPRKRIRLSPPISAVRFGDNPISPTPHLPPTSIPSRSILPAQAHSRSAPPPPDRPNSSSYPPEPPPNRTKMSPVVTIKPESRSPSPIAASSDLITHGTTFIEMIPSCRLGPPNDLAEARRNRKLWRAEQKAILESQGKIVEHLVTRDDGLAIDWRLPVTSKDVMDLCTPSPPGSPIHKSDMPLMMLDTGHNLDPRPHPQERQSAGEPNSPLQTPPHIPEPNIVAPSSSLNLEGGIRHAGDNSARTLSNPMPITPPMNDSGAIIISIPEHLHAGKASSKKLRTKWIISKANRIELLYPGWKYRNKLIYGTAFRTVEMFFTKIASNNPVPAQTSLDRAPQQMKPPARPFSPSGGASDLDSGDYATDEDFVAGLVIPGSSPTEEPVQPSNKHANDIPNASDSNDHPFDKSFADKIGLPHHNASLSEQPMTASVQLPPLPHPPGSAPPPHEDIGNIMELVLRTSDDQLALSDTKSKRILISAQCLVNVAANMDVEFISRTVPRRIWEEWHISGPKSGDYIPSVNDACLVPGPRGDKVLITRGDTRTQVSMMDLGSSPLKPDNCSLNQRPHTGLGGVNAICALPSPHGDIVHFITGGSDGSVHRWETNQEKSAKTHRLNITHPSVQALSYCTSSSRLNVGGNGGRVDAYDLTKDCVGASLQAWGAVQHVHVKEPNVIIVQVNYPGLQFHVHDWRSPRNAQRFGYRDTSKDGDLALRGDIKDNLFARGDGHGNVKLWDLRNFSGYQSIPMSPGQAITNVLFDPSGTAYTKLISSTDDNRLMFSDLLRL